MPVLRFFCPRCDRPLVTVEPGKLRRCPSCRAKIRAPLGLPVRGVDAYGRILWERDWRPGEALEKWNAKFRQLTAAKDGESPSESVVSSQAGQANAAVLGRIEMKLDLLLNRSPAGEWLSINAIASVAGLSASHVRRSVVTGDLPASNIGTSARPVYRISRTDLASWMEKRKGGSQKLPPKSDLDDLIDRHLPGLRGRKESTTR